MVKNPFIRLFIAFFLLICVPASAAEEKKTGSFFSGLRKPKTEEKKKFPSIPTLFSKASKETDKKVEDELTDEEKKLVEELTKKIQKPITPPERVKLPAPVPKVEPRVNWTVRPVPLRAPKPPPRPNEWNRIQVPQTPQKFTVAEVPKPPKVEAPSEPVKKQP